MPNDADGAREGELSTRAAAELCAFDAQPLEVLAAAGAIPGARFSGGKWYLPRTVLRHFGGGEDGIGMMFGSPTDVRP